MELMHHLHSQGAEPRKVVPLRAGGGLVGAFDEVALGKLMPTCGRSVRRTEPLKSKAWAAATLGVTWIDPVP